MLSDTELIQKIKIDNLISNQIFANSEFNYRDYKNNSIRTDICYTLFNELMQRTGYDSHYNQQGDLTYILPNKRKNNKCTLHFYIYESMCSLSCLFYLRDLVCYNICFRFHNWKKMINFLINEKDHYLKICDDFSKLKNSDKYTLRNSKSGLKNFRLEHDELSEFEYYFIPKKDTLYSGKSA